MTDKPYVCLAHRQDQVAFHAYVDRIAKRTPIAIEPEE